MHSCGLFLVGLLLVLTSDDQVFAQGQPNLPGKDAPVEYREHHGLLYWLDRDGQRHEVRTAADWQSRRQHILENLQLAMGPLPSPLSRVPLDVRVTEEVRLDPPLVARSGICSRTTSRAGPARGTCLESRPSSETIRPAFRSTFTN